MMIDHTELTTSYTHPAWCDLSKCEPSASTPRAYGMHYSVGTAWGVQADEAEFLIELVRSDDIDAATGVNAAQTRLRVIMQTPIGDGDDPASGSYADAWVDPGDARMLASILTRYAELADTSNRVGRELEANEVPKRRRAQ